MTPWCIDNVWKYMKLPKDDDDVCHICLDMVKEARDQLNSNETQEELKEVLEGSCNLIPIRPVAKECDTLVDEFIPELVEVLSSEMNPQVVCQTAGLCNSPRVDKLLEERRSQAEPADSCDTCRQKTETLKRHVAAGGQQQLLDSLLPLCRDLGSYSDACATDLATNIGAIYEGLQGLEPTGVCMLGNVCPGLFGEEPTQLQLTGPAVDCDLCIHIVKHWRDILVANTTKEEFKEILDGICSKTKAWAPKCTQLVDEYYEVIYNYLVNQMRAHSICKAIGLCAAGKSEVPLWAVVPADSEAAATLQAAHQPMVKLQPSAAVPLAQLTPPLPPRSLHTVALEKNAVHQVKKLHRVALHKSKPRPYGNDGLAQVNPLESGPPLAAGVLPLARLGLPDLRGLLRRNTELCDLCEFGMRELQKVLMDDATEDEITEDVGRLCDLLPATLTVRCHQFVAEYGDFVITLLAQEIDPSEVCPALRLCPLPSSEAVLLEDAPSSESSEEEEEVAGGPGCAICEYAMNTLLHFLQNKTTEREIRDGLDRICEMLPHTVSRECEELVNTFTEEIIDMIVSGMTADEICITLKLCVGVNDVVSNSIQAVPVPVSAGLGPHGLALAGLAAPLAGLPVNAPRQVAEVESEEQEEAGAGQELDRQSPVCVLCEFVMMQLKLQLDDNNTDAEIEAALERVCTYMPRSVEQDCQAFVDTYGAAVLDALKAALADPDTVCAELRLCSPPAAAAVDRRPLETASCAECQQVAAYAELLLSDGRRSLSADELCQLLPDDHRARCRHLVEVYGPWVFDQLAQLVSPKDVCIGIDLCPRPPGTVHLMGGARCLWGPGYFCQDEFHARACNAMQYCVRRVWGDGGGAP